MTELDNLRKELEPFRNTLVIADNFTLARLVDVIDGDTDYYYCYDGIRGLFQESCVGMWTPLKGYIPDAQYKRMVAIWNRNNVEKAV